MEKFSHEPLRSVLHTASTEEPVKHFRCRVFSSEWNMFVEHWAPRIHAFIQSALGPFAIEPASEISPLPDGFHMAGANASFNPTNGRVCLATHMEGLPGVTLEKLTHEFMHASLAAFEEGDEFYEEGVCDFGVWLLAHAPLWGEYREAMIQAAADNIRNRRDRALSTESDYDRKRWAGGLFMMYAYGPHLIASLRQRKLEGKLAW